MRRQARVIIMMKGSAPSAYVYIFILTVFCSWRDNFWCGTTLSEYYICYVRIAYIYSWRSNTCSAYTAEIKGPLRSRVDFELERQVHIITMESLWKYYFGAFSDVTAVGVMDAAPCTVSIIYVHEKKIYNCRENDDNIQMRFSPGTKVWTHAINTPCGIHNKILYFTIFMYRLDGIQK